VTLLNCERTIWHLGRDGDKTGSKLLHALIIALQRFQFKIAKGTPLTPVEAQDNWALL
jgi:hypothetical protein